MPTFSMVADPTLAVVRADMVCLECRANPNLIRLTVIAVKNLPCHCGEYDSSNRTAWLNTDSFQFELLKQGAGRNVDVQINVSNGYDDEFAPVSSLNFTTRSS